MENISLETLQNFCRTCTKELKDEQKYYIQYVDIEIRQCLLDATIDNPLAKDAYPNSICCSCLDKFDDFLTFRKTYTHSRKIYDAILNKKDEENSKNLTEHNMFSMELVPGVIHETELESINGVKQPLTDEKCQAYPSYDKTFLNLSFGEKDFKALKTNAKDNILEPPHKKQKYDELPVTSAFQSQESEVKWETSTSEPEFEETTDLNDVEDTTSSVEEPTRQKSEVKWETSSSEPESAENRDLDDVEDAKPYYQDIWETPLSQLEFEENRDFDDVEDTTDMGSDAEPSCSKQKTKKIKKKTKTKKKGSTFFHCNKCDYRTWSKKALFFHKEIHRWGNPNGNSVWLDMCRENLAEYDSFLEGDQAMKDQLEEDRKKFKSKWDKSQEPKKKFSFRCDQCKFRCCSQEKLDLHILADQGLKPYKCPKCNLSFDKPTHMYNHLKEIHDILEAQIMCEYENCFETFRNSVRFKNHFTKKHDSNKYDNYDDLLKNEVENAHSCTICGKRFMQEKLLYYHECPKKKILKKTPKGDK